jgi:hypothetical protein
MMYFFSNETDENILKLSFNAIKKPFKLQRSATPNQFLLFDQDKKNNSNTLSALNTSYDRADDNFCKDLLTFSSKS